MSRTNFNFSEKLNRLFDEGRRPDGSRFTPTEAVESSNGVIKRVHLWKLRKGQATNPSLQVVQALADFFGVDPGYFFENEENASKSKIVMKRDALVDKIALRSGQLDDDGKQAVLYMIESITKSKRRK